MRTRRRLLALVAIGAVLAAGCGSDRGEEGSGGTTGERSTETTAADGGGAGDFGDLVGVCGPNEGGGEVPAGDPAETHGITADTITVGTVADPGFEGRPGLNQEIFDTATAFVDWCNEAGGINGKQLELNLHDAAISEYQPVMQQSCRTDFAIVGSGAVQDNFWPTTGAACGLIDIAGFSVTTEKAGLAGRDALEARSVQPVPNAGDRFQVGSFLTVDGEHPDAMARSGIIYGDLDTLIAQKNKTIDALEQIGHAFVHEASYNILGEANWAPFAAALQQDDVQFLHFVGEGENLSLLVQAMDEVGFRPEVMLMETNLYDQAWLDAAGPAADGVYIRTVYWPFEEADQNPATQQYLDLMEASGGKIAQLGSQSMSSWLLFAQAARDCDREDDLTRTCVLEAAASVEEWTGGGLHAPTSPGSNEPTPCTIVLQVQDGGFTRFAPEEGYDCGEDSDQPYVVEVAPPAAS
jgi:ABC-type branched-subunit amino acid transport system substrate-binding protein